MRVPAMMGVVVSGIERLPVLVPRMLRSALAVRC